MKPFNLELAKAGAKVCYKDGRPFEPLTYNGRHDLYPAVGYVGDDRLPTTCDYTNLFMVQTTHKEWVIRWMDRNKLECSIQVFEETADRFKNNIKRLGFNATVHEITVED